MDVVVAVVVVVVVVEIVAAVVVVMVDVRAVELVVVSAISHRSPLHPNEQAQATPDPLPLLSSTAMQTPPF